MNNRLSQFLKAENISQSQFADSIGVARANISHILAGRNKPGYDFFINVMKNYPTLNIEWLLNGSGKMYKSLVDNDMPTDNSSNATDSGELLLFPEKDEEETVPVHSRRKVVKVTVYYSDNTFQELK